MELRPINTEIDPTIGEVVRDQVEATSTCKYSLVVGLWSLIITFPFSGYKGSLFN